MKRQYKITHTETLVGEWFVNAESEDAAIEEFMRQVDRGEIDFSYLDIVDSSDVAKELSEEDQYDAEKENTEGNVDIRTST